MKSLEALNLELSELNLEIRKLLLNKNSFREGLSDKIAVVTTISTLRERIVTIQREIRQITDGDKY
ncbi:hypothetical protein [Mucilaginibacter gotjawali]|uniref:Uncharacterized protein n=2 Tax=Mucilaginibacter gotjawali TaxID=1550579 RepID=A0A0X8X0F4_9SPHI|nr:hypothetical protein [Mucilaginibacter gotjawali]MBB3056134.1 hypothetical protein [Mucilaginibacter gotjawali]BAU53526.1 hypothetical protein MgSA37_01695 [Mucilaginibacter gotjawali]